MINFSEQQKYKINKYLTRLDKAFETNDNNSALKYSIHLKHHIQKGGEDKYDFTKLDSIITTLQNDPQYDLDEKITDLTTDKTRLEREKAALTSDKTTLEREKAALESEKKILDDKINDIKNYMQTQDWDPIIQPGNKPPFLSKNDVKIYFVDLKDKLLNKINS